MSKMRKSTLKDISRFSVEILTTLSVGSFATKVLTALIPNVPKRSKLLCCLGSTVVSWMLTDKACQYMKELTEPVSDAIAEIFGEEEDDDGDKLEQSQKQD